MDEPLLLTREQSRRVDAIAIERYGIAGVVLMENAGRGVVDALMRFDPGLGRGTPPEVAILCGRGNNGGDGFVIARHLQKHGVAAVTFLAYPSGEIIGDARINFEILTRCDAHIVELANKVVYDELDRYAGDTPWLVDSLLGTGAVGEPREPVASIIRWMNARAARRLAVDLPSGLDCDSGRPSAATVRADVTCTFVAPKVGMVQPAARPFVGELHVVSIGVPAGVVQEAIRES